MMTPRDIIGRFRKSRRFRIVFYAMLAGLIAGGANLLLPAEDFMINVRSALTRKPVPQDIVVIGMDDRTLAELGTEDVTRDQDAIVIRRLTEAGVRRIYFDRRYRFKQSSKADAKFIQAMKESGGRVYLPAGVSRTDTFGAPLSILPSDEFMEYSTLVGVAALSHPFGQMLSMALEYETTAGRVPSLAASMANRAEASPQPKWLESFSAMPRNHYRPDYSYDFRSIPTISYIDVLEGRFDPKDVAGYDVAIGGIAETFKDSFELPFQGMTVPGVYFHVIAAQTFRKDILLKLGWPPALLLVTIVLFTGMRRGGSFDRYRIAGLLAVLAFAPEVLNRYGIEVEVMPALLTVSIVFFRARSLDKVEKATETNVASGLPSLQSLRALTAPPPGSLVALKVRNYSAIVGSFEGQVEAEFASEIARRIKLGDADPTIYHESDKFLWISQVGNPVDIFEHLEGLHRIVQKSLVINGREIDVSFNCGVETQIDAPIERRLSNALQAAEQAVRDDELVCIYDSSSNEIQWEISLLSALDRAIDNGEVWVAYQPKAELSTGRIVGAEALARWTHPERGPISPEKFISIAEEYHRIDRITRFVLDNAVSAAKAFRRVQPDFSVSVNISAQLLRYPGLLAMILDALDEHCMGPDCLVLEITETDRLDRSSKTFEMMQHLVRAGLELSIDDFGTGNATIDYLRFLPASEVKIDKLFISGMAESRQDMLLVQSIVEMAHSLERRVVAEGVEDEEIMRLLAELGCDLVQGYYISRPVREHDLLEIMRPDMLKKIG